MIGKVFILVVWLIVFMLTLTGALRLISAPNTIENLVGVAVFIGAVALSVRTGCLTNLITNKKHEK